MNILEYLRSNNLYLDGGMGTLLQKAGLAPGELPELWNITKHLFLKNFLQIHEGKQGETANYYLFAIIGGGHTLCR